ncbi:MAG: type II toxin-antitoxin system death-on-curing family toxin [Parasphingorhabdus sp.]|nr:type II toxin-antitoxin system death-on-curing family toxin [Parasphingorhabdus sp.]
MPNELVWPRAEEISQLNQLIVEETGEPFSLLKPDQLESACARPYNLWTYGHEERMAWLATSLILGIATNHPFEQGNKRTGYAGGLVFCLNNGFLVEGTDSEEFGDYIISAVTGEISEDEFAYSLDDYLVENLNF